MQAFMNIGVLSVAPAPAPRLALSLPPHAGRELSPWREVLLAAGGLQLSRGEEAALPVPTPQRQGGGAAAWQGARNVPVGRLCCLAEEIVAACIKSQRSCLPLPGRGTQAAGKQAARDPGRWAK